MFGKIAVFEFFLLLIGAIGGYFYFDYNQNIINTLNANNIKLELVAAEQKSTIEAQQAAAKAQVQQFTVLQKSVAAAETQRRNLQDLLRQKDLAAMARANAADLEQRINHATSRAFDDMSKLTGATDQSSTTAPSKPLNYQPPPHPPVTAKGHEK
jgi:hypothetical protein